MEKILLVGNDLPLLATRVALLARTGAEVLPCNPSELATHVGNEKFDLVILCHTLEESVRRCVFANAQRRWPQARILQDFTSLGAKPFVSIAADSADELMTGEELR